VQLTKEFTPSPFQQAIFDEVASGSGDVQISAVAGSGKTETLIQLLKRVPKKVVDSTLLCAFNKEIQRQLERRAPEGCTTKTFHAIGLAAISSYHYATCGRKGDFKIDDRKYRNLIRRWYETHIRDRYEKQTEGEIALYSLVNFCRLTLTDPNDREAVLSLIAERELEFPQHEQEIMLKALPVILEWGVKGAPTPDPKTGQTGKWTEVIDYADMIWLPFVLDAEPKKFWFILVDEIQDLNLAQLHLILRCRKPGGRMVLVGDPQQAIYSFCGADARSWQKIAEMTGAKQLPLSVCYRCPRSVIREAQKIVSHIEAAPGAPEGEVAWISEEQFERSVDRRDMILCRTNAPLISWAFRLIANGQPAKVRGRDIGAQLGKTLEAIERLEGFTFTKFHQFSGVWRNNKIRELMSKDATEMQIASIHDRVDSLNAVYDAAVERGAVCVAEVARYVEELFADEAGGYILLSTVHKAKGLEAERVFILRPEQMPHPMSRTAEAKIQEWNLKYVAVTRAKKELCFVTTTRNA